MYIPMLRENKPRYKANNYVSRYESSHAHT